MNKILLFFSFSIYFGLLSTAFASSDIIADSVLKVSGTTQGTPLTSDSYFGASVVDIEDIDGDGINDIAISAPSVYVEKRGLYIAFMNSNGSIREYHKIYYNLDNFQIPHRDYSDNFSFGQSVASVGDLDNDGIPDIVVGDFGDGDFINGASRGAVFVLFLQNDGSVKSYKKIASNENGFNEDLEPGDRFGQSVASVGDFDGDGVTDIVSGTRPGDIYLLMLNADGTVKTYSKILKSEISSNQLDSFASSLAGLGDIDSDGVPDIAIGAPGTFYGNDRLGSVYIVTLNIDGTIKGSTEISEGLNGFNHNLSNGSNLGTSLSVLGDYNEDSIPELVIGYMLGDFTTRAGGLFIVSLNNNGHVSDTVFSIDYTSDLFSAQPTLTDFGNGVASVSDFDGDGVNDVIIGAPTDDDITNAGAIYIIDLDRIQQNSSPTLTPIGNQTTSEGSTLTFTVSATDPDGDNLTYSATNLPAGATFDTQTRTFTWTPGYNDAGNYPDVEFTVTDDGTPIELDVELITITVGNVNRAPVLTNPGPQSILETENLSFNVSATDPDNDSFTLSASSTPTGATFDPQTGTFSWTPSLSQEGVYTVTFTATDTGTPVETGSIDVVITVGDNPTPTEQAEDLIEEVITIDIPQNVENSYLANLQKVAQFIEDGKINAALNQLQAFVNKVEQDYQQSLLTQAEYDSLLAAANNLMADLGN